MCRKGSEKLQKRDIEKKIKTRWTRKRKKERVPSKTISALRDIWAQGNGGIKRTHEGGTGTKKGKMPRSRKKKKLGENKTPRNSESLKKKKVGLQTARKEAPSPKGGH